MATGGDLPALLHGAAAGGTAMAGAAARAYLCRGRARHEPCHRRPDAAMMRSEEAAGNGAARPDLEQDAALVGRLLDAMGQVVIGQRPMLERLVIGLLANGHVLIEGVPGIAKTLAVTTLAQALRADYQRIQFTPDLLPADLVGTLIYQPGTSEFKVRKGPIFAHLLLADEINRAPAKVQSALLEAMQENQVTIGEDSFRLPQPFLVLATQNPLEHDGTYPLPEAQVDRFMLKLKVTYPNRVEELAILDKMAHTGSPPTIEPVADVADVLRLRQAVDRLYLDDKIKRYIVDVVFATREPKAAGLALGDYVEYGASPRASIYLALAAKAHAFVQGRGYVTPQDVKAIGMDVLRHRVLTTYEADAAGITAEDVIRQVFDQLPVP
jgi:MoxR-like ATPase